MIEFFVPLRPRQKGNSRRVLRVGRQRKIRLASSPEDKAAECTVAVLAAEHRPAKPIEGPVRLDVTFVFAPPRSWPSRKRADALAGLIYPAVRPDRGNLLKLLEDALQGRFYLDDAQIVAGEVGKRYGTKDGYEISIGPMDRSK